MGAWAVRPGRAPDLRVLPRSHPASGAAPGRLGWSEPPSVVSGPMSTTAQPVSFSPRPGAARASRPALDAAEARRIIRAAEVALLDERRQLTAEELAELATSPTPRCRRSPPWPTRCAWPGAGPRWRSRGSSRSRPAAAPRTATSAASRRLRHAGEGHPVPRHRRGPGRRPGDRGAGAVEFCIVLAIKGPDEKTMQRLLELVPIVREETGLNVAVSAGILTDDQARASPRAASTATTTTWRRRGRTSPRWSPPTTGRSELHTCELVRENGMELCCGVLLGMGESIDQRLELLGRAACRRPDRGAGQLPEPMARARPR
jgi:hypothetical protein